MMDINRTESGAGDGGTGLRDQFVGRHDRARSGDSKRFQKRSARKTAIHSAPLSTRFYPFGASLGGVSAPGEATGSLAARQAWNPPTTSVARYSPIVWRVAAASDEA